MRLIIALASVSAAMAFTIQPPRSTFSNVQTSTALSAMRRGRPRGPVRVIEVKPPMNAEIKYDTLRVTVPNLSPTNDKQLKDTPLGVMSLTDALQKAKELGGLDVILINENSDPPVAKIVDYSKFRYEKEKKAKELKKNSKASELKEVKMSYKIDVHDYKVRLKSASKFIEQGNRVKCTIQFKGRENQHDRLGYELLSKMAEEMTQICVMEGKPKREGRFLSCILSPRPEVTKSINDKKRADEKAKKRDKKQMKETKKISKDAALSGDTATVVKESPLKTDLDEDDVGSLDDLLSDDSTDDLFN